MSIAAALAIATVTSIPFVLPALAAYCCPACYGMERLRDRLYVEHEMPADDRSKLQTIVDRASEQVAIFYGAFERRPTLIVCVTEECNRRTGGRGARAETYGSVLIRVSPRGIDRTILAHEFSHVELHGRVGSWRLWLGALPAWFDEGVAVIVSDDERYLKRGVDGASRCLTGPEGDLPTSALEWGSFAGKTPGIYAQAACRVLRWMDNNGGAAGLLTAIAEVAEGKRSLP
jgi:hypothetical protein